jgi:hypothetical protein
MSSLGSCGEELLYQVKAGLLAAAASGRPWSAYDTTVTWKLAFEHSSRFRGFQLRCRWRQSMLR